MKQFVLGRLKNSAANPGGSSNTLLSILPGGPSSAQIGDGTLLTSKGVAVTTVRSTANYCRTDDVQQLLQDPQNPGFDPWGLNAVSTAVGVVTGPFSDQSKATRLTESLNTNEHFIFQAVTFSAATYTASAYLQAGTARYATLADDSGAYVIVDLQTGTILWTGGARYVSSSIVSAGSGWYRVSMVTTQLGGASFFYVLFNPDGSNNPFASYLGTGKTLNVWGPKLELGTSATPVILPRAPFLNLLGQPEDLVTTPWASAGIVLGLSRVAGPTGRTNATVLTDNNTNSGHYVTQSTTYNITSIWGGAQTVCVSCYMKAGTASKVNLWAGTGEYLIVDLAAGTASPQGSPAGYGIIDMGSGWYRVYLTVASQAGTPTYGIVMNPAGTVAAVPTYVGTGQTILATQVQAEVSSVPTAYVRPALVLIPANQPRVESAGLLLEKPATNILPHSQALSFWTKSAGVTATDNAALAPDGSVTGSQVDFSAGSTFIYMGCSVSASTTYTFSVWLWTLYGTYQLRLSRTNQVTWGSATVSSTITVTDVPTRYTLTYTTAPGETGSDHLIGAEAKTPFNVSAGTVFAWGAQVEQKAYASSYIPTTTGAVAREGDIVSVTNPLTASKWLVGADVQPLQGRAWTNNGGGAFLSFGGETQNIDFHTGTYGGDNYVYNSTYDDTQAWKYHLVNVSTGFDTGSKHNVLFGNDGLGNLSTYLDGVLATSFIDGGSGTGVLSSVVQPLYLGAANNASGFNNPDAWLSNIVVKKSP